MRHWTTEEEAARLAQRFDGVNQAAFARKFAVPGGPSMVSQHIKGRRPINMDAALAYAKGFEVSLAEISPRLADQASRAQVSFSDDPPAYMQRVRPVPVIGQTQGGMPERIWSDGDQAVSDKFAEVSTNDEHAFACRVVGDSMVPRYMPGEYALVEPGTAPELEDDVLVRLSTGETMIKRLLSRRSGVRLGSYNTTEVLTFEPAEISWMYYVAHPIPARRIQDWGEVEKDAGVQVDRNFGTTDFSQEEPTAAEVPPQRPQVEGRVQLGSNLGGADGAKRRSEDR